MDNKRRRKEANASTNDSEGWFSLTSLFLCLNCDFTWDLLIKRPYGLFFFFLAEVSSIEWELIKMTDQEEDLIYRMYRLVGDR